MGTRILSIFPAIVGHAGHMDEDVVLAEHARCAQFVERRLHPEGTDNMKGNRQIQLAPDLPGGFVTRHIYLATHDHGCQLVIGGKVLLLDACSVGGIFRAFAPTLEIAEDTAPPCIAQAFDRGVRVFRRVVNLADVHHRGNARIQLGNAAEQFVDIDVFGTINLRKPLQDRLVVIGGIFGQSVIDQDAVGQLAAQCGFELVVVGVDKAGHDDLARSLDHHGIARLDIGTDLDDLLSVNQHVADSKIADGVIHGQHGAALDQYASPRRAKSLRQG